MKHSKLIRRAVAWLENHDNPNVAIYHTKNTREIMSELTAELQRKKRLQKRIEELEAELQRHSEEV